MCLQCLVHPYYFGEVLPGWFLIRARKDNYANNPSEMAAGDFGFVRCNDPSFIIKNMPILYPENDVFDLFNEITNELDIAIRERMSAGDIYDLVKLCVDKGYDPEKDWSFSEWFCVYLAKFLKTAVVAPDDENQLDPSNPIKLFEPLGKVINEN